METTDTLDRGNIRGRRERSGSSNRQEDIFTAQANLQVIMRVIMYVQMILIRHILSYRIFY